MCFSASTSKDLSDESPGVLLGVPDRPFAQPEAHLASLHLDAESRHQPAPELSRDASQDVVADAELFGEVLLRNHHGGSVTDIQAAVLDFIVEYIHDHGWAPSRREISNHFGWSSTNASSEHIERLVAQGYLIRGEGKSRALRLP